MKRYGILVGLWLVVTMAMTVAANAATYNQHYFNCKNCHKPNITFTEMGSDKINVCLQCHAEGKGSATLSTNPPPELDGVTNRLRSIGDASAHFGRNPTPGRQISHIWGVTNNVVVGTASLVQEPSRTDYAGFYSRYNTSTGKVTCSRCHNPHGEAEVDQIINATGLPGSDGLWDSANANRLLLQRDSQSPTGISPLTAEKLCRSCHVPFDLPNTNHATLSHPILADYASFQSGHATTYKAPAEIAADPAYSKVKLVEVEKSGTLGVGCTSCHGVHDVDSDSTTPDGAVNRGGLAMNWPGAQSDGHLLRSDGPTRKSVPDVRTKTANSTAQLRSNLCQSCHKYQLHGRDTGTNNIGCLDCHGGHSYNGGTASAYVLKNQTPDAVPVRAKMVNQTPVQVSFAQFTTFGSTRTRWSDNFKGTANGFCEKCHGDVENDTDGVGTLSTKHAAGTVDGCETCHPHSEAAFSFAKKANATTCGECHGYPPYLNTRGDIGNDPDGPGPNPPLGTQGGYAYNYVDGGKTYNYSSNSGHFKNETETAHKAHSGKGLPGDPGYWYFIGLNNCNVCHGANFGSIAGNHRTEGTGTFRDLPFDGIAKTGGLNPSYKTDAPNIWTCSNTYCHSSGGPRTGNAPAPRNYTLTVMTPAWDVANGGGHNSILSNANRCGFCHGNDATDMVTRSNSPRHIKHLNKGFSCNVCHATVAASDTALVAGATDGEHGGKHVNGTIEVAYPSSGSALFTALGAGTNGANWEAPGGTCSVYCHDPLNTGKIADWDDAATGACGTCHGVTAATLMTGSHAIHINSTKADISCDACHGAGAISGTHSGHVDGLYTKLTTAASCDVCHGINVGDTSPVWGNPSSTTCSSCHSGATTTSYTKRGGATVTAPAKAYAFTAGHNRPTASGAYPVTGKPAGNKQCSACHLTSLGTGHVDGLGNGDLLVASFSCESCHTAAGSRSGEATVRVKTHDNRDAAYTMQKRADFTKACLACHDPHGTSYDGTNINGAMLEYARTAQNAKDASGNYGGNVIFTALTGNNSFDQAADPSNLDDICATCHTTTAHNNRTQTGTHNGYEGSNCTTVCHGHNSDKGGFMPSGGTYCNDCHGNPPTLSDNRPAGKGGVHAAHVKVANHEVSEDKFDCEVCHPGAASFTAGHADGSVSLADGITNGTCSAACHYSGNDGVGPNVDDGYWTDTNGLNCDSCHYWGNPPTRAGNTASVLNRENLTPSHNKHFDANKACITCHPDNSADTTYGIDGRVHIDNKDWALNLTNDGAVLAARANAVQDNANVTVATWVDGTDTCSNAACHNPSGITKSATWGTPNAQNCDFCHSNSNPDAGKGTPGSHGPHMAATTNFGLTVACTSCHPNNTGNNGHLNGSVSLNGFTYSTSLTDYTSSTFGRCTTTTCHNNGRGTAVQTPVWGTASADCTICHAAPPAMANNRHAEHVANTGYIANPNACGKCHLLASATQITATSHIDGTRNVGSQITDMDLVTGGNQLVAPGGWNGTCTNNCHNVDTTGTWTDAAANKLTCLECHTSGKLAGGAYPNTGLHTGTLTVSQNTHDNSFKVTKNEVSPSGTCMTCHPGIDLANDLPATHYAGGAPAPGEATIPATVGYLAGSPPTCGPNGALINCHDDKGVWKRRWSTTATANNGTECGNCHGNFDLTWVAGISQRHGSDAQVHGGHNGAGVNDCYICHTFGWAATYPNVSHANHRDGNIQLNNGMLFNDDGATVHCTGCHDNKPLGLADGQYSFQDTWNGDGADGGLNRWGRVLQAGPPANCNGCHAVTNGLDHDGTNESLAVHDYHTGSPLAPGCGACHPADSGPGGALHQNNSLDFGGTYLSLTAYAVTPGVGGNFTNTNCSSANGCHDSQLDSWKNDTLASCGDCHAATTKLMYTGSGLSGYPPTSNEHAIHIANNAYVGATASTDCDDCHGAGASNPGHLAAHNDGILTMASKVSSYNKTDGTCANTCHVAADGRDWTSNTTLVCTDCHSGTYLGKVNKNHTSGLHGAANALAHDDSFGAGASCTSCHTAINLTTPASHVDGIKTDPNTTFGLFANYRTANGDCFATCHADGGDWRRKWTGVVDAKPQYSDAATAAVCGNCHGSFSTGWRFVNESNASTTDHTDPDADNSGDQMNTAGHQVCSACHGWGVAGYQTGTRHQNNSLTMNSDLGYNDGTGGCTTNCHHGLTLTMKTNSGFTTETAAYGGVGCGGCHDDGALPPNSGAHVAHGADSDTDYTECEACHGTNNGGSWTPGSGGAHNNGTVNFAAGISYSNGGTPGTNAAANNDTCTTSQCHSAAGNAATWGTPASVGCNACHYYEPAPSGNNNSTNANPLSPTHNAHFNKGKLCTDCHGTLPTNRTHIAAKSGNDGQVLTLRANAAQNDADPVAKSGMAWDDNANTCSGSGIGLGCHNTKPTPAWGTTGIACTACHTAGGAAAADPTSGLHAITPTVSATKHDGTLASGNCINCHSVTSPSSLHQNGSMQTSGTATFTFHGNVTSYSAAGCTATCHSDAGDWARKWSTSAANSDGSECANCHGGIGVGYAVGAWVAGISPDHTIDRGDTDTTPEVMTSHSVCKSCHGFNGAADKDDNYLLSMHRNNQITMNGGTSYNAANWGCDNAGCHSSAADGHAMADSGWTVELGDFAAGGSCFSCHGNGSNQYWPDGATYPDRAGAHDQHIPSIAAKMPGGDILANRNATCIYCHPDGAHSGDQSAAPADVSNTDSNNDSEPDVNTTYKFKKLIGGGDDLSAPYGGYFRAASTDKTCSNVACHANAPYTPGWYGDTVPPGIVNTLAATDNALRVNPEPGTVELTWTAVGDDNGVDGTAHRYDIRYRLASDGTISSANFASSPEARVPTVDRGGKSQKVVINGLTPGQDYSFALKTYDEAGNISANISNVAIRAAQVDNVAPIFWGINAVSANDYSLDLGVTPNTNSVNVSWDAASDHSHSLTTPLDYLVLWSEYSLRTHFSKNGAMPATIGTDACFNKSTTPPTLITCGTGGINEYRIKSAQTTALSYDVPNLPVGVVYNFLVRAKDQSGNVDSNRAELMAMAKSTTSEPITLQTLKTSATIPTATTNWTGGMIATSPATASASNAALGANYPGTAPATFSLASNAIVVWSPTTTYTAKTNVWGVSYQIQITGSSNGAATLSYQFGYLTGQTFTPLNATVKSLSISRRAPIRVIKFPLSLYKGTIPSGSKPAFVLKNTSANAVTLTYGSDARKGGLLLFNEQPYNDLPQNLGNLSQSQVTSTFVGGRVFRLTWDAPTAVAGETYHYDVFASLNGGGSYPYVVGRNLTTNTVDWDPVGDGITGNQTNVVFKVLAGDGRREGDMIIDGSNANNENHSVAVSSPFSVDNTVDVWSPAAITTLKAETRPKQGSVYLSWKAVGNDGFNHGTRATVYDIRFSTNSIPDVATFDALPPQNRLTNEPFPNFTGAVEGYEAFVPNAESTYYFAMKVGDATGNWSGLSNVVSTQSGPKCGICHSTPPDETATAGKHAVHGYTMSDCANCHGNDPVLGAQNFKTDHQDGDLKVGWKTADPKKGLQNGTRLYYTIDGTPTGTVIYDDNGINLSNPAGGGGFVNTGGDQTDNGRCFAFNAAGATGCHGPATPDWATATPALACSACHGSGSRTTDPYGRAFDATIDNNSVVPDQVKAAPPLDNHGASTGRYSGAHLKHLNSSFRLAKGDNCKLCHNGSIHADGTVDVAYDFNVTGAGAQWNTVTLGPNGGGTCGGTSVDNCHGNSATPPEWHSSATVACNECHGFAGKAYTVGSTSSDIGHVKDGTQVRACTWCHPAGHPQGTEQDLNSIMIPNNPLVGIAYRSGGIHLLKNINSRGAKTTEAELCWTCHDANGISEWGANNDAATGSSPYNYGTIFNDVNFGTATSNWLGTGTGAYWRSGTTAFQTIKKGKIQSTHSTNAGGTSAVTYDATNRRYNESLDAVADIRCSNCHDVHNMNKAPGDGAPLSPDGTPYLRGSWKGNPYAEDGPPLSTTTYTAQRPNTALTYGYGAVPRGGTLYTQSGGYYIDQNNVIPGTTTFNDYPTTGWTLENSAGLCSLCHLDVDGMDQRNGENLWMVTGNNGHSNSAIGGTFTQSSNIFDQGASSISGRPAYVATQFGNTSDKSTQVPDMGYMSQGGTYARGYGYRGADSTNYNGAYTPSTDPASRGYAYMQYDWGATVDAGSLDTMYHQFSCSKCHNPHASRLPKLLISNCLDVQHNTWDDNKSLQSAYTAATNNDQGKRSAYYNSAQNCHRYQDFVGRTATTVSFTAPNRINDSGSGFTAANGFRLGARVTVKGSAGNDRVYTISALANNQITVSESTITTASAGASITVRPSWGGWNMVTPWMTANQ